MTSKKNMGSEENPHKIIIKGKSLTPIEQYVKTLTMDGNFLFQLNAEYEALVETIVKLHRSFLGKNEASSILINLCFKFETEHQDRSGSLAEKGNLDLYDLLVTQIKEYIESLPHKYTLRIELPSFPVWDESTNEISKDIRFATKIQKQKTLKDLMGGLAPPSFGDAPVFQTCIEIETTGYSGWHPDSLTASYCLSLAKQCAFLLNSYEICRSNYAGKRSRATLTDDSDNVTREMTLPDSIARCFGDLIPNEDKLVLYESGEHVIMNSITRLASTNEEKRNAFNGELLDITRYFKAYENPDFESISTAIEWYQDSISADNQTFSYIAACIGLEALIGSDTRIDNMSNRLADRYAFLLGTSRTKRDALIEAYTSVLNLRGKLVHSKMARLSDEGVKLLRTAQKMLWDVIWHELSAIYKSQR